MGVNAKTCYFYRKKDIYTYEGLLSNKDDVKFR